VEGWSKDRDGDAESGFRACAFMIKAHAYTDFDTPFFGISSHTG
jgi:hypothetical protein